LGRRAETQRRFNRRFSELTQTGAPETPLADLFDRLPFNHRAALVLRYYADLSIAEIAEALGCPQGSVGPWIDRALKSLKEQLK
jgi:RNA polymerase sigma factor (sigma-70 family)